MVCLQKAEGSLGVLNLCTHNDDALLLKNLHKFYNREETPWVHLVWEKYYANGKLPNHVRKGSFWWRNNIKVLNSYKGLASVTVFKGDTCFFWLDGWSGQVPPLFLCKEQVHHCPECQTGYRLNHPAAPSNLGWGLWPIITASSIASRSSRLRWQWHLDLLPEITLVLLFKSLQTANWLQSCSPSL